MDGGHPTGPENLRLLLGLKVRAARDRRGWTLQELSRRSGLAVSYLSEIEKGKKFPKPEKLLGLASALGAPYEERVSTRVDEELEALSAFAGSEFLREFPFHLFGLAAGDLFDLFSGDPKRAGALLRTFGEIAVRHDVEVEELLFAALRSYRQLHDNSFPELEEAAERFRAALGWTDRDHLAESELRAVLVQDFGYRIDESTLAAREELAGLRSVFAPGAAPRLYLNARLTGRQRAYVLAREIGFRVLRLEARPLTSSWLKAESFDQVLNNFRASTFAGALLMPRRDVRRGLERLFGAPRFDRRALAEMLDRFGVSPEMLFYRIAAVTPAAFGLKELFFVRFFRDSRRAPPRLDKVFNLSRVQVPHGVSSAETICRRWPGVAILDALAPAGRVTLETPAIEARLCRFQSEPVEFLVFAMARPLALRPKATTSVSLGFRVDDALREAVRFLDDRGLRRVKVDLTCERCPLTPSACGERAAPPRILEAQRELARREAALAELLGRAT
jgi:transcriptional regulator with XRE-family HTH domain/Zn-dependent peptidase ImmA (M78 family)